MMLYIKFGYYWFAVNHWTFKVQTEDTAAMLVVQTREANEECLSIGNQHGRHDVICKPVILVCVNSKRTMKYASKQGMYINVEDTQTYKYCLACTQTIYIYRVCT